MKLILRTIAAVVLIASSANALTITMPTLTWPPLIFDDGRYITTKRVPFTFYVFPQGEIQFQHWIEWGWTGNLTVQGQTKTFPQWGQNKKIGVYIRWTGEVVDNTGAPWIITLNGMGYYTGDCQPVIQAVIHDAIPARRGVVGK